ncbi:MAG: endonuclease/exonuclease/phosphatase family protein [Nocardioidaceae bacterium]
MRRVVFWLLLVVLLVPAVTLTVLRLVQPDGGLWVRLVSFAPLAVAPYVLALLLVLGRLVVRRDGRRRWPWLPVAALVAAGLGLHVGWWAPLVTGTAPAAAAGAEPLTVMTSNGLQGGVDAIGLVQAASDEDVDVLVVEEVTTHQLDQMRAAGLDEGWPFAAGATGDGVMGTMVLSRFELGTPTRLGTRLGSWSVTVSAPDGELELVAAHATPPTDPAQWRADLVAVRSAAQDADLVVGDLNATLDHRSLQRMLDDGLRDAAELTNAGWQPTWPMNGDYHLAGLPLPPAVAIDHVLVGPRLTALSTRTIRLDGTDHAALVAEVALR